MILCVVQARANSTRLPQKIFKKLGNETLLGVHIHRLKKSQLIDKIVIATTNSEADNYTCEIAADKGVSYFRGNELDVLDRFYMASLPYLPKFIVRTTADCPLIDPGIIDGMIIEANKLNVDYFSNVIPTSFPDGLDVEIIKFEALQKAWFNAKLKSHREHVTPFIWTNVNNGMFTLNSFLCQKEDYNKLRITVDTKEDYDVIKKLTDKFGIDEQWETYINYLQIHPDIKKINNQYKRNEGMAKSFRSEVKLRNISNFSKSDEYRAKIHNLIPGGAHTYSKGDDQFPEKSPAAIVRGEGSKVWDLDGNKYLDCSMGLGSVTLGHAYQPVLNEVSRVIRDGVNFQRPSFLELEMAEKFLALVPNHKMIKFAKNGSTVVTAAVKLARAYTGRKYVAFPSDHPFYSYDDWFIGKSDCNFGVPEEIISLSLTYSSQNLESLRELFDKYPKQIACVVSEPEKQYEIEQDQNYLSNLIELVHSYGALFIQDEMVTGFKTSFPGSISKYNVKPDLATWGKSIANGFSFCALTGIEEVMKLGSIKNDGSRKLFLTSTTHGGETHALVAAIATIDAYEKNNVVSHMHDIGSLFIENVNRLISSKEVTNYIKVYDYPWTPIIGFKDKNLENSLSFKTLFMQEMIKRGVLFQGALVPSYSHTSEDVFYMLEAFGQSIDLYLKALEDGVEKFLVGKPIKPVFRKFV